jgi:hypothetical protein
MLALSASAQSGGVLGVAYYDVDALYDTIPSRFYNDKNYTPEGRYKWDSQRYRQKVEHIAQVIDSLHMPIVALYGVENEEVVRDITATVREDYAYIHRTQDFSLGLDFALLYYGDVFFPEKVTSHHNALCIDGYIGDCPVTIIINNNSSSLGVLLNRNEYKVEDRAIIVLGKQRAESTSRWQLSDVMSEAETAGRGTVVYYDRWQMRHRIATNIRNIEQCNVYIKEWLLDMEGRPKPTFRGSKYYGGYSTSLPIYIYFDKLLDFSTKKL